MALPTPSTLAPSASGASGAPELVNGAVEPAGTSPDAEVENINAEQREAANSGANEPNMVPERASPENLGAQDAPEAPQLPAIARIAAEGEALIDFDEHPAHLGAELELDVEPGGGPIRNRALRDQMRFYSFPRNPADYTPTQYVTLQRFRISRGLPNTWRIGDPLPPLPSVRRCQSPDGRPPTRINANGQEVPLNGINGLLGRRDQNDHRIFHFPIRIRPSEHVPEGRTVLRSMLEWREVESQRFPGHCWYYNRATAATTWQKPADLAEYDRQAAAEPNRVYRVVDPMNLESEDEGGRR